MKSHVRLLTFLILTVAGSTLFAQNKSVINIGIEEGLASPSVTCIFQDSDGLMWFGTVDGLCVYDGKTITTYRNIISDSTSIANNLVLSLAEDKNGNIWISTTSSASKFNKITRKFVNYDLRRYMKNPENIGNNSQTTNVISTSNGEIYLNCLLGDVLKYNETEDNFTGIPIEDSSVYKTGTNVFILPLTRDANDNLFIQVNGFGLFKKETSEDKFKKIKLTQSDEDIFINDRIRNIFPLNNDTLFLTTENAIYQIETKTNNLKQVFKFTYPSGNWGFMTNTTAIDKKGNVWFTSKGIDGVLVFDRKTKLLKKYDRFVLEYINTIALNIGISIYSDHSGMIWLGTGNKGIFVTDPSREPFQLYKNEQSNPKSISRDQAFGIAVSSLHPEKIYVGTAGGGVSILNEKTNEFEQFPIKPINDFYKTGSARSLLEAPDGKLWVGTWGDGLRLYDLKTKNYIAYTPNALNNNSIINDKIRVLTYDRNKNLWIGGDAGLEMIDSNTGKVTSFYSKNGTRLHSDVLKMINGKIKSNHFSLSKIGNFADTTVKVVIKKEGKYCLVSVGEGNSSLDFKLVDFGKLENDSRKSIPSFDTQNMSNFYFGGNIKNRITVASSVLKPGTYYLHYISDDSHSYPKWNSDLPDKPEWWGVHLFEISEYETDLIVNKMKENLSNSFLSDQSIRAIKSDTQGNLFIGTNNGGIQILNTETKSVQTFKHNNNDRNSLSNNNVQDIFIDSRNQVWIATSDGLNKFDLVSKTFKKYSTDAGFATNFFSSVIEDNSGDIWVSTLGGISRLSYKPDGSINISNYDRSDGLLSGGFTALVAARSASGRLYFGGNNGLNAFYPGQFNIYPPDMAFTGIRISKTGDALSDITKKLYSGQTVSLSHDQNDINIDFAALHFTRSEKNKLSHQLLGYDENWVDDNRNFANYTNLPTGNYTFRIKGANSDGYWTDGSKSFSFTISPPLWATWWAYCGYGFLLIGFVYSFGIIQKKRLIAKSKIKILEAEHDRKTKELEEARQLQLSMLPKIIPQFDKYDIAVYMKTSTEVGGDYYDFNVGSDGTLTIVIGDATGHGLRAGTLVTATKSLFNTHGGNKDILFSLKEFSRCIMALDFYQLSMCMTFVKIRNNEFQIGSAGMPPLFIYRSSTQTVEEHVIVGAPLGTFSGFPYKIETLKLETNDVLLLMTDGFPELISNTGEVFNYSRVNKLLKDNGNSGPKIIISEFEKTAENWLQGKEADDDITFVVLKMKS